VVQEHAQHGQDAEQVGGAGLLDEPAPGSNRGCRSSVPPRVARVTGVPLLPKADASGTRSRLRISAGLSWSSAIMVPRPPARALCE
jgi:hypothetical protein